jgi:hypothetical protein
VRYLVYSLVCVSLSFSSYYEQVDLDLKGYVGSARSMVEGRSKGKVCKQAVNLQLLAVLAECLRLDINFRLANVRISTKVFWEFLNYLIRFEYPTSMLLTQSKGNLDSLGSADYLDNEVNITCLSSLGGLTEMVGYILAALLYRIPIASINLFERASVPPEVVVLDHSDNLTSYRYQMIRFYLAGLAASCALLELYPQIASMMSKPDPHAQLISQITNPDFIKDSYYKAKNNQGGSMAIYRAVLEIAKLDQELDPDNLSQEDWDKIATIVKSEFNQIKGEILENKDMLFLMSIMSMLCIADRARLSNVSPDLYLRLTLSRQTRQTNLLTKRERESVLSIEKSIDTLFDLLEQLWKEGDQGDADKAKDS